MNNKRSLLLTIAFITITTFGTSVHAADDSWFKYFVGIFWNSETSNDNVEQPKVQPQQQFQNPKPSAPPLDNNTYYNPAPKPAPKPQGISQRDRLEAQQQVDAILDNWFATKDQEHNTKLEIQLIKNKTVRCITERTQHIQVLLDYRNALSYYLNECLANILANNARFLYEQKAAKATNQPLQNPAFLAQQTEDEIKTHALKAIKLNEKGSLSFFVGKALEERIAKKIAQDYARPKPSAPPAEPINPADNIKEVYVHENAQRYEESIAKIQAGKVHRETDCCVCLEDFGGAKKRVTLVCGHSICPECLYTVLHKQQKYSCPVCRSNIQSDEFPAAYLQKHR